MFFQALESAQSCSFTFWDAFIWPVLASSATDLMSGAFSLATRMILSVSVLHGFLSYLRSVYVDPFLSELRAWLDALK